MDILMAPRADNRSAQERWHAAIFVSLPRWVFIGKMINLVDISCSVFEMIRKIKILTFLTVVLISCSTNKEENMTTKLDKFTWNVQLAGYNHNQADQKGETDYQSFIKEFETFPWIDQIEKANQYQDKVSPTLSVKDLKTEKDFWISMAGDKINHGYIIGYIYPKVKKGLFGLGKPKQIRWLEIRLTEDTQIVKELIKLFFDRNYNDFELKIRKLEDFGQMQVDALIE